MNFVRNSIKVSHEVVVKEDKGADQMTEHFNTVDEAIAALQAGKFIILADDESRENEGDLVALGQNITPQTVYRMLKLANGLMCVPVSAGIAEKLGFKMMVKHSTDPNGTPFMVTTDASFDAAGVTTGVSAFDRAATINLIADAQATPNQFNHPGHIQPLIAEERGVRARTGHTEAAVDLAYLAGKAPVAVIIEVLKPDGHMARRPELTQLAAEQHVPFITIPQIKAYLDDHEIEYAAQLAK